MKKKKLFVLLAALLICVIPLSACGESLGKVNVKGKQDTSYAVFSNGGSVVQYGNYVYFINGYRGYEDENAKNNRFGEVVKGALYRAELLGADSVKHYSAYYGQAELKTFTPVIDDKTGLELKSSVVNVVDGYEKDGNGDYVKDKNGDYIETTHPEDRVDVQLIAPKVIGTDGYSGGGIFVYENFVYYASPNNLKDKTGTVQVKKTDFLRTKLDGTVTQKIYTTQSDSSDAEYMFYRQGGFTYLTAHDGTDIVSVKMSGDKIYDRVIIAQNVTSVYMPLKEVYYKDMPTNGAEDFVYFTRAIDETDAVRSGNVLEMIRPNGEERIEVAKTGKDATIVGVDNGYLFYKRVTSLGSEVVYTNLHDVLTTTYLKDGREVPMSPTYTKSPQYAGGEYGVTVSTENLDSYSKIYCFRPNVKSNQTYALGVGSANIDLYNGASAINIYGLAASVVKIDVAENTLYLNSGTKLYATNLYEPYDDNKTVYTLSENASADATFIADTVLDYVLYFTAKDDTAADYAALKKPGTEDFVFIGKLTADDIYDPADELNSEE